MSKIIKPNIQDIIIQNVYRKEIDLLNNINEYVPIPVAGTFARISVELTK
jgi:hypothetical protein